MAQYVKMTNGSVSILVNITDTGTMNEKMNDGFYADIDSKDEIVLVDSSMLSKSEDDRISEVLNMVKAKQTSMAKSKNLLSKK